MLCVFFFCFKQKTAYEMRISDWSSDVCSSDLRQLDPGAIAHQPEQMLEARMGDAGIGRQMAHVVDHQRRAQPRQPRRQRGKLAGIEQQLQVRSEEHTSELQSLMRISYAVFCLKKNKQTQQHHIRQL